MVTLDTQFCSLALVFTVLVLGLIWYAQFLWNRRNLYIYSWNVPGPLAFPLIGSAYLFTGTHMDVFHRFLEMQEKFPGLCKLWFGPQLLYTVGEPEYIRMILTNPKCMEKNFIYNAITSFLGPGILTAPLAKWKKHRKLFNPSFNQNILDSYVKVFAEQSNILTQQLLKNVGKKSFDLYRDVFRCTLDIIFQNAIGAELNIQTTDNVFAASFSRLQEIMIIKMLTIWQYLDFVWKLFPMSRELEKHVNMFRGASVPVIKRKIEEFRLRGKATAPLQLNEREEGTKERIIFDVIPGRLDFTEDDIIHDVEIFVIAGSDTTAATMCFVFIMLGMFQDIQQKVYEEVMEVVGEDRDVAASDLPNLKYAERVIKETLRLLPTIPIFLRTIGEDIDLGTTILPAGSSAMFCPFYLHRDPKYWPDPLRFDPDRFLPEEVAKRQPNTYIPFSLGPRNCIGWRYGMMSSITILATVIRKYKIFSDYKTIDEIKLDYHVILKPAGESKVSLELR